VKVVVNNNGTVEEFFDKKNDRQILTNKGNQFVLYEDIPMYWDAWDVDVYHLEKRSDVNGNAPKLEILESGPLRATIQVSFTLGKSSSLKQTISLTAISPRLDFAAEVEWQESHKFLKVEFPLNIRAIHATYEIQFGHWQRPTHWNTSWDVAKFEVCAHKWADLSESGYGVSLLNDSKYGHAAHGNVLRLSLLRSAKNPDPEADMGHQSFKYALFPHVGTPQEGGTIKEAYNFNVPLLPRNLVVPESSKSFFWVDKDNVVLETVKKAEDSEDIIVRLYESHGGRGKFHLASSLPVKKVSVCNLLEEEDTGDHKLIWENGKVALQVKPCEIVTLKLHF